MIRRTSALALAFLLVPSLFVSGSATAKTMDASHVTATSTSTSPARTASGSVCSTPARKPFVPLRATVAHVGRNLPVYPVRSGSEPPVSAKWAFGWDKYGPKPGSAYGNVRFTAHTYPWSEPVLGNKLLLRLKVGMRIVLKGRTSTLCYRVRRIVVTTPTKLAGYYNTTGKPKLAIVVCSGKRLGPGNWTNRTIWFARPSTY